jgi:hypothetical protein
MIKLINILKEIKDIVSNEVLEQEASSIQGKRIIATIDDFESGMIFPSETIVKYIANKYNVGYIIKKYSSNQAIIFYNKSNQKSKEAIDLYNRYMNDYSSLSDKDHISLGKYFGYSNEDIKNFIKDINSDSDFIINKEVLKPQTVFQVGKTYELVQDIPQNIKFNLNLVPVIKKGDKFKVTKVEPNPSNQFWMVYINAINYPEKQDIDFRITPPNIPSDKYDKFVFKNLKEI